MGALSHIRVLDLSRVLAGPWCAQTLADLGADVIKIERPEAGDDTRDWGPPYLHDADGHDTHEAAYYLAANRNKRSVTVDIATPEGQRIVRELAAQSDVVLENFKVGPLQKYGLDYASLQAREARPRLLLDHRLRPDRAVRAARRLRLHHPGHGRPHEHHRRARRPAGRRAAEGRRRDRRPDDRHVRDRSPCSPRSRTATAPAKASTSTWRCSTCRSRCSPT